MALENWAGLKATIADFLNREDLTVIIPTFIELAEAQINRDVRHWRMENRAYTTISNQYLTRPSDWVETINLRLLGNNTSTLELLSSQAMDERRANSDDIGGTPQFYRHIEDQFEVWPNPSGTGVEIELVYYQKITPLGQPVVEQDTRTAATNWLLTDAPDIYLYGSLLHSAPYLENDPRLATWAQLYSAAVQRLKAESEVSIASGSGLKTRIRGLDTSGSGRARYWRLN